MKSRSELASRHRCSASIFFHAAVVLPLLVGLVGRAPEVLAASQAGDPCGAPQVESCTNGVDDDGDGWVDCLDEDCTPAGADFVCAPEGILAPACRPLLEDRARLRFKLPIRPDFLAWKALARPVSDLDPATEPVRLTLRNVSGEVFGELVPEGTYVANARGVRWKLKRRKTGASQIWRSTLRRRVDEKTGEAEYVLRFNVEGDLWRADPTRNVGWNESELANMTLQLTVGDDAFFVNANWERCPCGWNR